MAMLRPVLTLVALLFVLRAVVLAVWVLLLNNLVRLKKVSERRLFAKVFRHTFAEGHLSYV